MPQEKHTTVEFNLLGVLAFIAGVLFVVWLFMRC